jgi:NADPH2:quinone reductase
MRAIQVNRFGGPEVLELHDVEEPVGRDGLIPVQVSSAGINYADTHQVENRYHAAATLPLIPGAEVVGVTPSGERVVALLPGGGGYAERCLVAPALTVPLPDDVEDSAALALVLQGLTAWHLLQTSARMLKGDTVVVHAAAGGVGTLAVQLARRWGAGRVVAIASSADKRALAVELGADVAVDSADPDLAGAMREACGGQVDIVLEMTGGPAFVASLEALAPFGRLISYGMASRDIPAPLDVVALNRNSQGVLGFWLVHCLQRPGMFEEPMRELLELVQSGELRTIAGGTYPLAQARQAHEDLRARRTVGKLVLDPRS